jgi:hypothetical protein
MKEMKMNGESIAEDAFPYSESIESLIGVRYASA